MLLRRSIWQENVVCRQWREQNLYLSLTRHPGSSVDKIRPAYGFPARSRVLETIFMSRMSRVWGHAIRPRPGNGRAIIIGEW